MIDISQMVRSANPVSGDSNALKEDELDALLHLIDTRSESMEVNENLAPVKPPRTKRAGWMVAAAAFVAVLVIGTALFLTLPGGEDSSPATPTEPTTAPETTIASDVEEPEPVEEQVTESTTTTTLPDPSADEIAMAQQLIDARSSGDFDSLRSLLTADASLAGPFPMKGLPSLSSSDIEIELDKLRDAMAFETTLNAEWTTGECRLTRELWLSCELRYTDDFVRAIGQVWDFEVIADGRQGSVERYEMHYRSVVEAQAAFADFLIWLDTQSPEDARIAGRQESGRTDEGGEGWVPRWTEASASVIATYLDAYLAATG